ncbi:hypothetical protein [Nonomuraea maheshkhaliensis]
MPASPAITTPLASSRPRQDPIVPSSPSLPRNGQLRTTTAAAAAVVS